MPAGLARVDTEERLATAANDAFAAPRPSAIGAPSGERRAPDAVARLAQEMARLGAALDRRIDHADRRAAEGLTAARAEFDALEAMVARRLEASAAGQARALDDLRDRIEAAVDRLSRRIEAAERAGAEAAAALGERIATLDAALEASHARLGAELEARLQAGERRTQGMIGGLSRELSRQEAELQGLARATAAARPPRRLAAAGLAMGLAGVLLGLAVLGLELAAPGPDGRPAIVRLPTLALRPTLPFEIWPRAERPRSRPAGAPAPAPPRPAQPPPATTGEDLGPLARALSQGDASAVAKVQALAAAGHPQAALLLAKLYEAGQAGLARDMALARQWTQRAAEGGERAAMHNLAVYLMNGEGGPVDAPGAAHWFRRAAEAGVVDAQYNVAVLYEAGRGAPRNFAEAYRWFSIAANAGDGLARGRALALEGKLTARERSGLAAEIGAFAPGRPGSATEASPVMAPAATLAQSQQLLAREGYYIGPTDGADSAAYRAAADAYLRDHPEVLGVGRPPP